jgi:glycogen synthase
MPIKVLMFGWELPPFNSGGLGTACYGLSRALASQNVDITFVLPSKVDVKADFMRIVFADLENIDWSRFSAYGGNSPNIGPPGTISPQAKDYVTAARMYAARAAKLAQKYRCDVIHAHDWLCFPAGIVASQATDTPLVSQIHATEYDRSGGTAVNPVVYTFEKQGLEEADAVIAVSNFTKNLLMRHYAAPGDKISVVHNGVDTQEWPDTGDMYHILSPLKQSGFKIILYAGRFTLQKGVDYFLKAAQKVIAFDPKTVFLLVGSGDMENQLIRLTVELGISDHVLFAGFLRGEMLKSAFRAADIFVMPSVSEPYGIMALESISSGTPAIISYQSGVSETMSHVLKADFWDVDEMANQILSVIHYPSLHTTLKSQGKQEVKKASWDAAATKTKKVYEDVVAKKGTRKKK